MNTLRIATILLFLAAACTAVSLLVTSWAAEPPQTFLAATILIQYVGPFAFALAALSIRVDTRAAVFRYLTILAWTLISVTSAVNVIKSGTVGMTTQIVNGVPVLIGWYLGPVCLFWSLIERAESVQGRGFRRSGRSRKWGYVVAALAIAVGLASSRALLLHGHEAFSGWLWNGEFLAFANGIVFYLVSLGFFTARGGRRQGFLIGLGVVLVAAGGVIAARYPDVMRARMLGGAKILTPVLREAEAVPFDERVSGLVVAAILATWSILPLWLMLWVVDWTASHGLREGVMAGDTDFVPHNQTVGNSTHQ